MRDFKAALAREKYNIHRKLANTAIKQHIYKEKGNRKRRRVREGGEGVNSRRNDSGSEEGKIVLQELSTKNSTA